MELYAKYLKNKVRITFNVGPNAQSVEPKEYDSGSKLGTINVTANNGYEFKGWYTTQTFDEGTLVNEQYTVENNITLYAKVELKQYTVTFNVGDNAQPIEQKTYTHGTELGKIVVTTNEGYEFKGWYTETGFSNKVENTYSVESSLTLYAKIELKQYTITFNIENAQQIEQKTYAHGNKLGEITVNPTEGYEFKGWYTETGFINKVDETHVITNNLVLYGKTELKQYTVTFDVKNAQLIKSRTYTHGTELGNIIVTPNEGYEFKGWYAEASFSNKIENTYKVKSNVTLYAKVELKQYTVTFNVGSNAQPIKQKIYNHGTQLGNIEVVPNNGYEFKGWYTESSFTNKIEDTQQIISNMTLYAKVELKQYAVTFNIENAQQIKQKTYAHGNKLGEITVNPNEGYEFKGWYTEAEFINKIDQTHTITNNLVLYGKVEIKQYTVTFNISNAKPIEQKTYNHGVELGEIIVTPNNGYEFKGWYTEAEFTSKVENTYQVKSNVTLYAKVELKQYTVTFNIENGQYIEPKTYNHGTQLGNIEVVTNAGYEFKGWYTEAGFTNKIENTYSVESSLTLYAKIEIKQYTVTFNIENAQSIAPKTYNHGTQLGDIKVIPNEGYEFKGWYNDSSFNTRVENTQQITNNLVLYGKVELKQYTVTFNIENARPIEPKIYNHGQKLGEIPVVPNAGYIYKGIYTTATFSKNTLIDSSYIITSNITLYVKIIVDKATTVKTPQECDYFFTSKEDFKSRIGQICTNNNNDLSEVTLGFDDSVTELKGTKSQGLFPTTLIKAPTMIFGRNVRSFECCFHGCSSLTTIPTGLFDKCTQVTDFCDCFCNCYDLVSIPTGLFNKCTKVTNFSGCFNKCSSLETIPTGLFDNCTQVTDFSYCFCFCYNLLTIPYNLFDKCTQVTNFMCCFMYCESVTSAIPDAWNKEKFPNVTYDSGYASDCTQASNYAEIPIDWK